MRSLGITREVKTKPINLINEALKDKNLFSHLLSGTTFSDDVSSISINTPMRLALKKSVNNTITDKHIIEINYEFYILCG